MTSPEADIKPVEADFRIGLRYGSRVVRTKTDIESINFSIIGPSPGIFSARDQLVSTLRDQQEYSPMVFSIFLATESRKVRTCQRTAWSS